MVRSDGRRNDETRKITISYDRLDRVDGSARFGFGNTKTLSSISGPVEVRLAFELASKATLEVNVRPLSNVPGTESKSIAAIIRSVLNPCLLLNQNPRTLIQLVIQSLSPSAQRYSSPLVSSMINSSMVALLNTGSIPLRGVICSVSVGRLRAGGLVLDPSEREQERSKGGGCLAFLFALGLNQLDGDSGLVPPCELAWTNWSASPAFEPEELLAAQNLAKEGAVQVWNAMKASLSSMGIVIQQTSWKDEGERPVVAETIDKGEDDDEDQEEEESGSDEDSDAMET